MNYEAWLIQFSAPKGQGRKISHNNDLERAWRAFWIMQEIINMFSISDILLYSKYMTLEYYMWL